MVAAQPRMSISRAPLAQYPADQRLTNGNGFNVHLDSCFVLPEACASPTLEVLRGPLARRSGVRASASCRECVLTVTGTAYELVS